MVLTGKQKAALLLMSLDAATAAELLKGVDTKVVQELAVELAYLDAAGYRSSKQSLELARQFWKTLQDAEGTNVNRLINQILNHNPGKHNAEQIRKRTQEMLKKRKPFITIQNVEPTPLAAVLEREHPQTVAIVLSDLPPKKSSQVLGALPEGIRVSAIRRMTRTETVTAEAKAKIAEMVCKRLQTIPTERPGTALQGRTQKSLRKVAVIIRNLGKELRDGLLGAIRENDEKAGDMIENLMIVWEDIYHLTDRTMQKALRGIDSRKLALALVNADDTLAQKIKSNISERAAAALDEEASLISRPEKKDVEEAREEIVQVLREMNEEGELALEE